MKFSILIPVYNVESYLGRCVDSVLAQSYGDYEIILVNDGSTDDSGMMCDVYVRNYPDVIRVLHKENQGLLSARRVGVSHALGEYVCFMDSDDYWKPYTLSTIAGVLNDSEADVLCFGYDLVDENNTVLETNQPSLAEGMYTDESKTNVLGELLVSTSLNSLCTKCVRLSCLDRDHDYSPFYGDVFSGEDLLQTLPIFDNAQSIQIIHAPLYNYYQNSSSITQGKYLARHINSTFLVYRELGKYVEKWGLDISAYVSKMGLSIIYTLKQLIRRRVGAGSYTAQERVAILDRMKGEDIQEVVGQYSPQGNPLSLQLCYHCFARDYMHLLDVLCVIFGSVYRLKVLMGKRR